MDKLTLLAEDGWTVRFYKSLHVYVASASRHLLGGSARGSMTVRKESKESVEDAINKLFEEHYIG